KRDQDHDCPAPAESLLSDPPTGIAKCEPPNRNRRRQFESSDLARLVGLPSDQADESENKRNKNSKIEEPESEERHFEFALFLGPARMKFENGAGVEMIADHPNKKRCRNERAQNEGKNVAASLRIAGDEKADQYNAQRHESVNVKERHRC